MDDIVVNFGDSLLRQSDVTLLEPCKWLNDNVISFAMEYFETVKYNHIVEKVAFINPSVAQCIKLIPVQQLGDIVDSKALEQKRFLFLPLNDNCDANSVGGTHWTLLILDVKMKKFYHMNSAGNNAEDALYIISQLKKYLHIKTDNFPKVINCPQQNNSSDCGVYVIAFIDFLCEKYSSNDELIMSDSIFNDLTTTTLKNTRQKLRNIVNENKVIR